MDDKKKKYLDYIDGQMKYFDSKSCKAKKRYLLFTIGALCLNAIIPVFACFSTTQSPYKVIVAAVSAASTLLTGIALTMNFRNDWKNYRDAFGSLEAEKRGYEAGGGEYGALSEEESFQRLYSNCEKILLNDRKEWKSDLEGKKA